MLCAVRVPLMSHLAPDAGERFGWEGMANTPPYLVADPTTAGWARSRDDPHVQARREHLRKKSGIRGLEVCTHDQIERVVRLFMRDGFVAVADVLEEAQLRRIQAACTSVIAERVAATPEGVTWSKPNVSLADPDELQYRVRQPGRYSFGSHNNLHRPEWAMLADLPRLSPLLTAIFQSEHYCCWGAGGDFCLPGTIEYQHLHRDIGPGDFKDPAGRVTIWDLPPFCVTCNFPMVDFTWEVRTAQALVACLAAITGQ